MVNLLKPLRVKGLTLKNRIVMPPMRTSFATTEGAVTGKLIEHYVQRSKGLGLLIVEHSYVSLEGKHSERQLGIFDDKLIEGLKQLTSRVHAMATSIVIQINHAGNTATKNVTGKQPVGPSTTESARALRIDELDRVADDYASAAERAIKAGFDGVEVHGAHGYLLNQFYSPLTNKREDEYGGLLENRMRFPIKVVKRVKGKMGGRPLFYRLGSVDLDPRGTLIEDSKIFAKKLEEAGVDVLDVSGGLCRSRPTQLQGTPGYFIPQAHQIKDVVEIPVIGVGGIADPKFADQMIHEGRVDLVAVGRALLSDPNWAITAIKKLKTGSHV